MTYNIDNIITMVVPTILALVVFYLQRLADRRKYDNQNHILEADLAAKYQQIANEESDRRHAMEERLQNEIEGLKGMITAWSNGVSQLIGQLKANGQTPVWTPESDVTLNKKRGQQ